MRRTRRVRPSRLETPLVRATRAGIQLPALRYLRVERAPRPRHTLPGLACCAPRRTHAFRRRNPTLGIRYVGRLREMRQPKGHVGCPAREPVRRPGSAR